MVTNRKIAKVKKSVSPTGAASTALALSRRVQADGIDKATDEEAIAKILIDNAAVYIDLLKPFDTRADVPAGVALRQA